MKPREGETGVSRFLENKAPGGNPPAGNEGVGEHVRTKSQLAKSAGETADLWIRTDEENFFLLPSRVFVRANSIKNNGPAV